jgi:hypothetical protein
MKGAKQEKKWRLSFFKADRSEPFLLFFKVALCIITAGGFLFIYIDKQNQMTGLRIAIPILSREVKELNEENIRLKYEIDQFESPIHLMEISRKPQFGHLKFPFLQDVIILPEAPPLPNLNSTPMKELSKRDQNG